MKSQNLIKIWELVLQLKSEILKDLREKYPDIEKLLDSRKKEKKWVLVMKIGQLLQKEFEK